MLTRFNRKTVAVLSGVTASLLVAFPASAGQDKPVVVFAEPQENLRTERVSYADLDLTQRADQRTLNYRVAGAVKRVCLFEDSRSGLQLRGYYSCASGALDGAAPQIAQAIDRAEQIAMTGKSSIAAAAITINVPAS